MNTDNTHNNETRELRSDLWLFCHFCLHDSDFQEALRTRYQQADIERELTTIEQWFKLYIKGTLDSL